MIATMMLQAAGAHGVDVTNQITLGSIIVLLGVVGSTLGIILKMRNVRRENEKDIDDKIGKATSDLKGDIAALKQQSKDFMPRSEIEKGFEHGARNREQIQLVMRDHIRDANEQTTQLRIQLGKVEQAHAGLEDDVSEIKTLLKEQRQEQNAKLDRLQECLNELSKKV